MRRILLPLIFTVLLLAGCGPSVKEIPGGLTWTAQVLQSQEDGSILAAASGEDAGRAVPVLDITAQVEDGEVTLTDHASGETFLCTLGLMTDGLPADGNYALTLPDGTEGYAVYGITRYADGSREATLFLVAQGQSLRLTAPFPEE